jgi:hypothetical protein
MGEYSSDTQSVAVVGARHGREREGSEEGWRTVEARGKGKLKEWKEQTCHLPLAA